MDLIATALPALQEAFALILQPEQLLYLTFGVLLGLSVGVFPGLGGIAGLSLVLPFIFGMDPVSGLALMVGLVAVVPTSDTFASVLMGIPGSSASQATVLDGFPLARKGEAARALAAGRAGAVLRQGAMGCLLATGGTLCAVAPHRVTPLDTNGAGDCHIGSFIAELARSGDAARAARYANVAAALSITQAGPATAPAREQVLPLL